MLVLASSSEARQRLLRAAGLAFEVVAPAVDEARLKQAAAHLPPRALALHLARAKAESVSARLPKAVVIGCDQLLSCQGELFSKPQSMADAARQLERLQGRLHTLHTALCCLSPGAPPHEVVSEPNLTVRSLSPSSIQHYLTQAGPAILQCVGCYQIEGPGVQLFDAIEGDIFAIQGLPLLPLLAHLRAIGEILP